MEEITVIIEETPIQIQVDVHEGEPLGSSAASLAAAKVYTDEKVGEITPESIGADEAGAAAAAQTAAEAYVDTLVAALNAALALKAAINSPNLTGTPLAPTAANGTNTQQIATTAFVQAAVALLVNSSPALLDTLKELADALGDDPNFATTVTNLIAANLVTAEAYADVKKAEAESYADTGLATKMDKNITDNVQTDDYTLALTDNNKHVRMNKGTAVVLTVPNNNDVAFPVNPSAQILIDQLGAGQVTITPAAGVTINCYNARNKTSGRYAGFTLVKTAINTWWMEGNLTT